MRIVNLIPIERLEDIDHITAFFMIKSSQEMQSAVDFDARTW